MKIINKIGSRTNLWDTSPVISHLPNSFTDYCHFSFNHFLALLTIFALIPIFSRITNCSNLPLYWVLVWRPPRLAWPQFPIFRKSVIKRIKLVWHDLILVNPYGILFHLPFKFGFDFPSNLLKLKISPWEFWKNFLRSRMQILVETRETYHSTEWEVAQ